MTEAAFEPIAKPVPPPLAHVIDGARAAGVYAEQDWLIPNRKPGQAGAVWLPSTNVQERDDALVYRIVKLIAARAGVHSHVHALRAAFAVYFLEAGGDKYDLQLLMGTRPARPPTSTRAGWTRRSGCSPCSTSTGRRNERTTV